MSLELHHLHLSQSERVVWLLEVCRIHMALPSRCTSSAQCVSLSTRILVLTQSCAPPFNPDVGSHEVSIVGVRLRLDADDHVLAREGRANPEDAGAG